MGSSETESGLVDCSVGSIVWVRRRNGSWWPGKILGADELSASHLMSPRSGTPVKLLGREDASVDWYNLEKSKRVKAFRCGEFDDCIERAEASQGMPPKKREKYARREDAILHALELERQFLDKKCGGLSYSSTAKSNKTSDDLVRREALTASEPLENGNGRHIESKSHKVSDRSGFLLEYKSTCNFLSAEGSKDQKKLSVDGDNFGVPSRMRGLQDFGPSTSPPVHTHPASIASVGADQPVHIHPPIASDGADQPVLDSSARAVPDGIYNTECLVNTESKSLLKKSTPLEEGLVEEILAKRRDRRRPLAQVLESSENLPVSVPPPDSVSVVISEVGEELSRVASPAKKSRYNYLAGEPRDSMNVGESHPLSTLKHEDDCPRQTALCEQIALCEQNASGSTEFTESDSSETDSLESDTDDDLATLSDGAASIELEPKYTGRSEAQQVHGSMSSDELDELTLADGTSHPCHQESVSGSFGVSKWQLKGKRNNRSVNKRLLDPFVGNLARRTCHLTNFNENGITGRLQDDLVKQRKVQVADFGSSAPGSASRNMFNWGDWDQPASKGYWEESKEYFDPVNSYHHSGGRTMLIDVDLKVQSSYQREHVPMISLRSKINGQAIVGHPIQVEALSNGSSESLLEAIDYNFGETFDNDTALQPTWRTARRTASVRGRRPHVANALGSPKGVKHVQCFDRNKKVPKASVEGFVEKGSVIKKSISRPAIEKTFSRKPGKKISLSSYQKTRTLSSIASQQKHSDPKCSSKVDGAIKPETLPTVVACIPVKLVFSRLNEELVGRHQ